MQNTLVSHLVATYRPDATILHGSRARGRERMHSDWDFILLYNQLTDIKSGRILYEGQNIEFSTHVLPITNIFDAFDIKLQGAKVLHEKGSVGTTLLEEARAYYAQGVHWPEDKISSHRLWTEGRINGMKDNIDNQIVFNKYFTDFYGRVFNYWYWLLRHQHSQPIYIAAEEVLEKDPEYYELVSNLVSSKSSPEKKVSAADAIYQRLFSTTLV